MEFTYNASALGAGGVIERADGKVVTTIPSLASVALAPTGGEGRSVVSNYYSEELEFAHAETRVFGRESIIDGKRAFTTFTYVLLRKVRIFDSLRIAEVKSTVTSTRGLEDDDDHQFDLELEYHGVRIKERDVFPNIDVRLRDDVKRYGHLNGLLKEKSLREGGVDAFASRFNATPDQLVGLVNEKKPVQGTFVESLEMERRPAPPTIFVPGLGTVRFGELMMKPGRRRLNLLRINFGLPKVEGAMPNALMAMDDALESGPTFGPSGGSMTLGSGEGNGTPVGP